MTRDFIENEKPPTNVPVDPVAKTLANDILEGLEEFGERFSPQVFAIFVEDRLRTHKLLGNTNSRSRLSTQLLEARYATDCAYEERNKVVALLARHYPAGRAVTAIPGWDPEWHNCVYVDTPSGQLSWHYHTRDHWMFKTLPVYVGSWDGHTTPEKYERVEAEMDRITALPLRRLPSPRTASAFTRVWNFFTRVVR